MVFFINFIILLIALTFQLGSAERPYGLCAVGLGLAMTHSVISGGMRGGFVPVFILWITFLAGFANELPSPKRRYGLCAAGLGFAIGGISLLMVGMGISSGQYSTLGFVVVPAMVIPFMVIFFLVPGSGGQARQHHDRRR